MSDELEPCPFCNDPMDLNESGGLFSHVERNSKCPIRAIGISVENIESWNTRPLCPETLEAAAKVAENWNGDTVDGDTRNIARAIRNQKGEV